MPLIFFLTAIFHLSWIVLVSPLMKESAKVQACQYNLNYNYDLTSNWRL